METPDDVATELWTRWTAWDPDVRAKRGGDNVTRIAARSLAEADDIAATARALTPAVEEVRSRTEAQPGASLQDRATLDYASWLLREWAAAPLRQSFEFPVAPYVCAERTAAISATFGSFEFNDGDDVDAYIELLRSCVRHVQQMSETLWSQSLQGIRLPAQAIDGSLAAVEAGRDTVLERLRPSEDVLRRLDDRSAERLGRYVERIATHEVDLAYRELLDFLSGEYRRHAPTEVGFGRYPGGDAYYASVVRSWTTTELSPDEIHRIGLEQVAELTDRLHDVRMHGRVDPKALAAAHVATPEELTHLYAGLVGRAVDRLGSVASVRIAAPWAVERLHPRLEEGMTYGYYDPPTGASGTGTYYFNASHLDQRSTAGAPSLMAHELMPGHHLQIACQLENDQLPALRREPVLYLNAFIEGWAEYAADLGWDLGLYDEGVAAFGRVDNELFLAQRLVVDTGLNAMGWSLDRARDFMVGTTTRTRRQIDTELLRYATDLPGQALSYRLGHLELLRIRDEAHRTLGDRFDRVAFHDEVLRTGALPLPVLNDHIARWAREDDRT